MAIGQAFNSQIVGLAWGGWMGWGGGWRLFTNLIAIHMHSLADQIEIPKVIAELQHICKNHVSFALLVGVGCVFPAGFLHILPIMFPEMLKGCLPILSQHMTIHQPIIRNT